MFNPIRTYTHWLHTRWPAGRVEKLPVVNEDGSTDVPGLYIIGDLTGVPLLKFAADTGARAVQRIAQDPAFQRLRQEKPGDAEAVDVAIIGGGVSGMAAALEAKKQGLTYRLLEASQAFSTIVNFPKGKPIFTYPTEMTPAGDLQFTASVKEPLVAELEAQTKGVEVTHARAERVARQGKFLEVAVAKAESILARRVIVGIGRSGNFRKLGVPGENLGKVFNRLHDPKEFAGKHALVVGGGDSALETAIALAQFGAQVTLSYRNREFSRPKPENIERIQALQRDPMADVQVEMPVSERVTTATGGFMQPFRRPGRITLLLGSRVKAITDGDVTLIGADGKETTQPNDVVFAMIGREPPLDFFRRSGVRISGEGTPRGWALFALFMLFIVALYDWKADGFLVHASDEVHMTLTGPGAFPNSAPALVSSLGAWWAAQVQDRSTLIGTLAVSMKSRSFYYTLLYTICIGAFGLARIRRRRTPYVRWQTITLFLVQALPLFLLPELLLPWMGYRGWFNDGTTGGWLADHLFEKYISATDYAAAHWPSWGHPRAYWRAYGFILFFPLNVYNVLTPDVHAAWLIISAVQTLVILPAAIYLFGKGVYCGWICSCGALAETMGDAHRTKMPHGPLWNRLNMLGQAILGISAVLLGLRIYGWVRPESWVALNFDLLLEGKNREHQLVNPVSYKWVVDIFLGGIIGVGLYFKYSGRVWCRFACPLAALMHVYARFSRFAIVPEKKKCISCNVCTSMCHMGIDIMNFANKGLPMKDPECVRCSACVQSCPTGVLQFGQVGRTGETLRLDRLAASPVLMRESAAKH
ncbi:MAG: NAD(P)-binding domain-containing protein [Candidatus Sumerlaeia bacterium]|nr:NAD(P)-binding domain-containing protein [Candidatus Sumerlaeia bacterium]